MMGAIADFCRFYPGYKVADVLAESWPVFLSMSEYRTEFIKRTGEMK